MSGVDGAVAVLGVTPDTAATVQDRVTAAGASWTRINDELVVTGPPDAVARVTSRSAPAGDLRLVRQNGALFQLEHPDVAVVAGRGRHLVVRLDPARPIAAPGPHVPCYAIGPLPRDATVVAPRPPAEARRASSAGVRAAVDRLSTGGFLADLRALTALPTRFSTGPGYRAAARLAGDRLAALGYAVSTEPVPVGGGSSLNVLADRPGRGPAPRDAVLVTAHLDSINTRGGPAAPAPGADDNGSGSAGLLAVAAALADADPAELDLRLILFGGEEQGLFGSRHHVGALTATQRERIRAVVNMDMIGTLNTPAPGVLLEGAEVSRAVVDGLAAAAAEFTGLAVTTSLMPFNSDHVPFLDAGIPAVLTIEGADGANPNIHSAADTLGTVDAGLALEILRMNVGFLAGLLGGP